MIAYSFTIEAVQLLILLFAAPAFAGWVKTVKCRMQGRTYAGIFQPYRDIAKLFAKEVVLAENASWIFRVTPYIVFGVTVMIGGIIPLISIDLPFAATADVIALVMLFAIIRFFTALAGMDIGTAFGGMGSSREMTIASLAEPAMLMAIFTVSLASNSTSLTQMVQRHRSWRAHPPAVARLCAPRLHHGPPDRNRAGAGRQPVDPPGTDDDPRGDDPRVLRPPPGPDRMGRDDEALHLFHPRDRRLLPVGDRRLGRPARRCCWRAVLLAVKLAILGVILVLIETGLAKMRLFRLTEFLGSAFLLATLGMLSFFILE